MSLTPMAVRYGVAALLSLGREAYAEELALVHTHPRTSAADRKASVPSCRRRTLGSIVAFFRASRSLRG